MTAATSPPTLVALPGAGAEPAVNVVMVVVPGDVLAPELDELGRRLRQVAVEHLARYTPTPVAVAPAPRVLAAGPIAIDLRELRVTVHGDEIHLRHRELRLLEALLEHPGRVFSRRQLLERAWDQSAWGDGRTVDVHIRRLREKLGAAAGSIVTVRGFGYRLDA